MKQHFSDSIWQRLASAARQVPDDRAASAPYGFAVRVAALANRQPAAPALSFALDRFSWRALALSCLIMAIGVVSSYTVSTYAAEEDQSPQDLISEIINQS